MTTASAIKDALITNLSAASVFGPEQVSTDYGVMESTSACCCVVSITSYENNAMTFGNNRHEMYNAFLQAYIKDTGNHPQLKRDVFTVMDKMIATLKTDDELQGTAKGLGRVQIEHDPELMYSNGGPVFALVEMLVEVVLWD